MTSNLVVLDAGVALLGAALEPVPDARVVTAEGRVVACGRRRALDAPPGSEIVEATGLLLAPGFIDAHVHIGFVEPADVLRGGVTTVRDLAWPLAAIRPLAQRSRDPAAASPLVLFAGQMLTAPGGYPTRAGWAPPGTGREVTDAADAVRAVEEQVEAGCSVVKVALNPPAGPVLGDDVLAAIVAAAHARGRRVTAHVHGLDGLERALASGVDELAHMLMGPEEIPGAVLARMAAAGTVVVPTLSVRFDDQEVAIDNTRRFLAAGGRVVYGTDLGDRGPVPGIDPREVDALRRAGLSPLDVVRAATVDSAAWLGLPAKGVIAPGIDADLVALPLAALEDHASLTDVRAVWRAGRRAA